jgi:hypothetical protein
MQTFLVSSDYAYCAHTLDSIRLNSQLNESLVIIRSLFRQYPINPRSGASGWENHTVARMWRGHELQLAKYALAHAYEFYKNRDLPKQDPAESHKKRRERWQFWRDFVTELEDQDAPDTKPALIGDEEFHSAFRALLKYKECQAITHRKWTRGEYPDHASHRNLLRAKRSWKRENYEAIWNYFGRPEPVFYGQWGWDEEPDDMKVFYREDRIPQMERERIRKIEKPLPGFLLRNKHKINNE